MCIETELIIKINNIKSSNVLNKFIHELNNHQYMPGANYSGRVKDYKSALTKFKEKGYSDVKQMTDLAGVMGITQTVDQVYKLAEYIRNNYEVMGIEDDYIKNPKLGYQSYHINIKYQDMLIEIQLKTQDMYRAQRFVHGRIYKNNMIPSDIKPDIMKPLFPMIIAAPEDTLNRNVHKLEAAIKNFESIKKGDITKYIENNLDKIRAIFIEDLNKVLADHIEAAKEIKSKINLIDNNSQRLKEAGYWLGDYENNIKKLQVLNRPFNRLIRKFNGHVRKEYEKLNNDLQQGKRFLKEYQVADRHDFEKQVMIQKSEPKEMLTSDLNNVSSVIDNILESIREISKSHNDRSFKKQMDIDR